MSNSEKLQKHPLFMCYFNIYGRYFVRIRTPNQRLHSRVVAGNTLEEAAGIALVTVRVLQQ